MELIEVEINKLANIEAIKSMKTNSGQNYVITSVVNNGLKEPIRINRKYYVLDGISRVKGCIERGDDSIKAFVIDGNESQNNCDAYILNDARIEPSAIQKSERFIGAVDNKSEEEEKDICISLGVQSSKKELNISKAHKSKFKKISELSETLKQKLHFYRIGINTCYELAKAYTNTDEESLQESELLDILEAIVDNKLSEKKAISYIKAYRENKKVSANIDGTAKSESKSSLQFKKTHLIINISKHFQTDNFTFTDVTEEDKTEIAKLVDKIFEFLKDKYINGSDADNSENTDIEDTNFLTKNAA